MIAINRSEAYLITGQEAASVVTPESGVWELSDLHRILSCHEVEVLPLAGGLIMIVDEEARLSGKPLNVAAERVPIFGAAIVCPKEMLP